MILINVGIWRMFICIRSVIKHLRTIRISSSSGSNFALSISPIDKKGFFKIGFFLKIPNKVKFDQIFINYVLANDLE